MTKIKPEILDENVFFVACHIFKSGLCLFVSGFLYVCSSVQYAEKSASLFVRSGWDKLPAFMGRTNY